MIKFIQAFNIFIFVISFQIKTAIQSLSDFNSQNFNSKELAKKILPQKYHYLSDVYCAIKHSNQRENIVELLQCFDTIKTSYHLPSEIQKKLFLWPLESFLVFQK